MKEPENTPLRYGYTTGSCAAACAKAALLSLVSQEGQQECAITIPAGERVRFVLHASSYTKESGYAAVIKDGGDDPDATHGAVIEARATWTKEAGITIDGGQGVGRVTKPGLPVPVGEAAINPVPRSMIRHEVEEILELYGINRGVRIVISVPDGEQIALRTMNGRLGILGGISILGTRGIVVPFSNEAYKESITQAIRVAVACGSGHAVLSTGGRSEKYGMTLYPELPEEAFIEMGDFVGHAVQGCKEEGIRKLTLVGMMGKLSKLAQGAMEVHSKSSSVDFGFLSMLAGDSGASSGLVRMIQSANTAVQAGELMKEAGHEAFFSELCKRCCLNVLRHTGGSLQVETVLITLQGGFLGRHELAEQ
jgi:cobalt-precorrin-5B (C1)-methyltransferase